MLTFFILFHRSLEIRGLKVVKGIKLLKLLEFLKTIVTVALFFILQHEILKTRKEWLGCVCTISCLCNKFSLVLLPGLIFIINVTPGQRVT